ncbi:MAG: metallophosphoesterase [Limisphaera sp.]|nr:metallophosphoesterase [Limisphaera sp.]
MSSFMRPSGPRLRKVWILLQLALAGCAELVQGRTFPSLDEAYAAAGFDPWHPDNAVVVLFSDPHMNLWADVLPITTNLDARLIRAVHAMNPPPRKIIVAGDTATTLSPVPGWVPYPWSMELGTNEMRYWLEAIRAFTNVAPEDIVWIPGNHDVLPFEEEAATYRQIYRDMPIRQRLDIAGVRFLLINCGNYGGRNPAQYAWLQQELRQTPMEQPIVVVNHVPPFHNPVWYRGTGVELRELFGDRPVRWWTMGGHYHGRALRVHQIGRSTVASLVVGTSNPLNTNGGSDDTGFAVLCLSNGVQAVIYYSFNLDRFEWMPEPDWENPEPFFAAFEDAPGLLWRRLKKLGQPPEVEVFRGDDAIEWYAYVRELQLRLPLEDFEGQATHLIWLILAPSPDVRIQFEAESGQWVDQPFVPWTNFLYATPIPEAWRARSQLRVRYLSELGANDFLAGWGLVSTSAIPQRRYPRFREVPAPVVAGGETLALDFNRLVIHPHASYDGQRFALLSGPEGAWVDSQSGRFEWRCPVHQPEGILEAVVAVFDTDTPVFGATQSFQIQVRHQPRVEVQPPVAVVRVGGIWQWTPEIAGLPPVTAQWYFQGRPITEPLSAPAALSISPVSQQHAGWYHLIASNAFGAVPGPALRLGVISETLPWILLPYGSEWSFLDEGEPDASWQHLPDSASGWRAGRAPFGYGWDGIRTPLGHGRSHPPCTAYFGSIVVVPEGLEVFLRGRLRISAGAVVYWNGQELLRHRLPAGPLSYGPWAIPNPSSAEETVPFVVTPDDIVSGTNWLAVQVHRTVTGAPAVGLWSFDEPNAPWRSAVHAFHWQPVGSGIVTVPGRFGLCVSNGAVANSWLTIADHPLLRVHGPFTVGGWAAYRWGSGDDPESTILEKPGEFRLYYTGTRLNRFRFRVGDHEVQDQTPGTASGQWRWIVAWFDGARAHIQVDLGPVYSAPAAMPRAGFENLRALHRRNALGGFAVDELFYFPRVLTPEERTNLYQQGLLAAQAAQAGAMAFDLELEAVLLDDSPPQPAHLRVQKMADAENWELVVPGLPVPSTLWFSTNLVDWIPVWRRPADAPMGFWSLPIFSPVPEFYKFVPD